MDKPVAKAGRAGGDVPGFDPAVVEETALHYDRCHPGDTFSDLVHRSSFSKEDRRLLEDWLAATLEARHHQSGDGKTRQRFREKPDIGEVARVWREAIQLAARCP